MASSLTDRALKERIIGAVVLVVVAVLVVPVFLDGPANDDEMISEVVTLPGQNNQERKRQTIVLDQDRSDPVPAASPPVVARTEVPVPAPTKAEVPDKPAAKAATTDEQKPEVVQAPPSEAEKKSNPAAAAPAESPQSATGMWAVQLGSFSDQQNAERLAANLREQGYAAFLSQLQTGGASLHRVRVGPQKDRESAERIEAQLAKGGHKGQVVPHP